MKHLKKTKLPAAGLGFTLEIGKRPGRICPADDALLHGGHIEYTLGKTFPHEFLGYILILLF